MTIMDFSGLAAIKRATSDQNALLLAVDPVEAGKTCRGRYDDHPGNGWLLD